MDEPADIPRQRGQGSETQGADAGRPTLKTIAFMTGLGVTSAGSVRLSPVSANGSVMRPVPNEVAGRASQLASPAPASADAPTAVPHLYKGTPPAQPRAPTPPQQSCERASSHDRIPPRPCGSARLIKT